MEYFIDAETLDFLWSALNEKKHPRQTVRTHKYFEKFIKSRWVFRVDLEDVLDSMDSRLNPNQFKIVTLVEAFGVNWQQVCYRPNARSITVTEFDAITVEDATFFLIILEQIGFSVDPSFLVKALLPEIKSRKKTILSSSELEIFWFERCRYKNYPLNLMIEKGKSGKSKELITTDTRYKIDLKVDETGKAIHIKCNAPKFRDIVNPVRVTCTDCGMEWYKGDPDSSANHRKEHKRRMAYLDPKPNLRLIEERESDKDVEMVNNESPEWKHYEMYSRALAFKREFCYDFTQWQSPKGDDDPKANGILFTDEQDAIVGACSFRDRTGEDGEKLWGLDWVWFCPKERRNGHLSRNWDTLRKRYGDFIVESPVSDEMLAFLKKKNDSLLVHYPKNRNKKEQP